jgi:ABC-type transport system substrate-binding protein
MTWKRSLVAAIAITAAIPLAAGCGRSAQSSENTSPSNGLVSTTRPGTSQVGSVIWAVYRDVNSLDPIFAFDYPENTADSLMCESLLRQTPDGAVVPGLASMSQPSPTRLVFTIMCTGAYMLKSWRPGVGVLAVANPHYWNPAVRPLVQQILIKGVPDVATLTAALETGAIQGTYSYGLPTLDQLKSSRAVKVYEGPGWSTDAFVVSSLTGVLGDVRVRRALSMALDRRGIVGSVYRGAALMPRWLSNPGTFGYARDIFEAAYDSSPVLTPNIPAARRLVQEAGATGKTLTIGSSSSPAVSRTTTTSMTPRSPASSSANARRLIPQSALGW